MNWETKVISFSKENGFEELRFPTHEDKLRFAIDRGNEGFGQIKPPHLRGFLLLVFDEPVGGKECAGSGKHCSTGLDPLVFRHTF